GTGRPSDIPLSKAVNWGNSSLLLNAGRNVAIHATMTGGTAGDLTALANGNLTIGAEGVITGKTVALSTIGAFINNRGSDAVTASDRWLVYSNEPDAPGENFGNLNSNNTAIWKNLRDASAVIRDRAGQSLHFRLRPWEHAGDAYRHIFG